MSVFGDLSHPSTGWVPSSTNLGWTPYGPLGVYPYYPSYSPSPCPSCGHCPTCGRARPVPYTFPNTWTSTGTASSTDTVTYSPSPDVQAMMEHLQQQQAAPITVLTPEQQAFLAEHHRRNDEATRDAQHTAVNAAPACPSAESGAECEHD